MGDPSLMIYYSVPDVMTVSVPTAILIGVNSISVTVAPYAYAALSMNGELKGVAQADSFNFNAHKMIGTPLTCSVLVTQDKKYLYESLSMEADYLYQTDVDDFNLGKTSLQCGRRNNALKFWTLWKSVGTQGLETIVDNQFMLADTARDYVKNHPDYSYYSFDESVSVCFNYKNIQADKLCTLLYEHAELVIGFGTFRENTFIRLVTVNPNNNKEEIIDLFKTIEEFVANNPSLF